VTGMHRSGTSWLGAMLSARGELLNIQEPLNVNHGHTILTAKAARWYSYISATNEREYLPWYRDALDHRIHTDPEIARPRTGGWSSAPSPRCTTSSGCSYATTAATSFTKLPRPRLLPRLLQEAAAVIVIPSFTS
jgi:hypothetical protein